MRRLAMLALAVLAVSPSDRSEASAPDTATCPVVDRRPDLALKGLTKEALERIVPFSRGHKRQNVREAYARYFRDFVVPPPSRVTKRGRAAVDGERLELVFDGDPRPCDATEGSFRFRSIGVWYFFEPGGLVRTIRLDRPFAGIHRGIRLKMSEAEIRAVLGTPREAKPLAGGRVLTFSVDDGGDGQLRVVIDATTNTAAQIFD